MIPRYVIAVDWGGAVKGAELWAARVEVATGMVVALEQFQTRQAVIERVMSWVQTEPSTVVGFDFAFSAPDWFVLQSVPSASSAIDFWPVVAEKADSWVTCSAPPFWGKAAHPKKWPNILREYRKTELTMAKRPTSIFQLVGRGQVGLGSIRGMPFLTDLVAAGCRVWPFQDVKLPLIIEIWPSILKTNFKGSKSQLLASLTADPGVDLHKAATSNDAYDALVSAVAMAHSFTTGVGLQQTVDRVELLEGKIWLPDAPAAHPPRGSAQATARSKVPIAESDAGLRLDTAKAAVWGTIAGLASLVALAFAPGLFPGWYTLLVAVGYGLLLPPIAVLHVRHAPVRASGAMLATAAGTATVAVGIAATGSDDVVVAALFVRGIWWWTAGKMWAETGVLPRALGTGTMALGALSLAAAVASAPLAMDTGTMRVFERALLGLWTLALSFALWRTR